MRQDLFALFVVATLAAAGCGESAPGEPAVAGTTANDQTGTDPATAGDRNAGAEPSSQSSVALTPQNTKIGFVGTKPDGSHTGGFQDFSGRLELDAARRIKRVSVEIQTESLWSDNNRLTNHLKTPDFFSVHEYPIAKFESTRVEGEDNGLTIAGNLTLHGTTREISFPAQASVDSRDVTLSSEFKIDRTEFGMNYDTNRVDPDVTITVAIDTGANEPAGNP